MSDSEHRGGFSFQLSESPPPARAEEQTPLGDLDLDLDDFGSWGGDESGSAALASDAALEPSPALEAPVEEPSAQARQPGLLVTAPEPSPEPPALEPEQPALEPEPPVSETAAETPAPRIAAPQPEPEVFEAPPPPGAQMTEPETLEASTETIPGPTMTDPDEPLATAAAEELSQPVAQPRIKKIQFPARSPQKNPPARPQTSAKTQKAKPKTRFSESISAPAVRAISDSEPPPAADDLVSDLQEPDDLPTSGAPLPAEVESAWGTDTPSAKEIWKTARKAWNTTARQARVLGGQGLRASKHLAQDVNKKMRERLEAAAQEREAKAALQISVEDSAPKTEARQHQEGPVEKMGPAGGGSVVGPMILGAAKATGRKLAAPAAAIAAATAVYMGGTHLLGVDGGVALSKAAQGPEIPELGTLKGNETEESQADESAPTAKSSSKEEKKTESPKNPEMQVEVAEMPEGLSFPGKGLIEVVTSEEELIYVDDVFTGRGPLRRIPVSPGKHEVSIRSGGESRGGTVQVEQNKNTRAVFKSE